MFGKLKRLPSELVARCAIFGLLLFVVLVSSACTAGITDLDDVTEAAEKDDGGLAKKWADSLLGEVSGQDHRAVRMCMIAAVASELVTYRISLEPDQATMGFGQIVSLEGVVAQFEAADGMWLNTEIAHVTLTMTSIMVDNAKARLPKLLGNLAGGINVAGLIDRAAIAAGQGSLLAAGVRDIRERIRMLTAGTADPETSMRACKARLALNKGKVGATIGMPPQILQQTQPVIGGALP